MSYSRLGPRIEQFQAEVAALLAQAEATDLAEDEEYGEDKRGDEVPPELARRETRIAKMRAAKEAIEADAGDKATQAARDKAEAAGGDDTVVAEAAIQAAAGATPEGKAQRSFTDPEARMMKTVDGFHYAYNVQAVVDEYSQVVVAVDVTQQESDDQQLIALIEVATASLTDAGIGDNPTVVLADAGYCSEDNLQQLTDLGVNAVVATGKIRHKAIVEPVFGQMKRDRTPNTSDCEALLVLKANGHSTLSVTTSESSATLRKWHRYRPPDQRPGPDQRRSNDPADLSTAIREDSAMILTHIKPQPGRSPQNSTLDTSTDPRT